MKINLRVIVIIKLDQRPKSRQMVLGKLVFPLQISEADPYLVSYVPQSDHISKFKSQNYETLKRKLKMDKNLGNCELGNNFLVLTAKTSNQTGRDIWCSASDAPGDVCVHYASAKVSLGKQQVTAQVSESLSPIDQAGDLGSRFGPSPSWVDAGIWEVNQ